MIGGARKGPGSNEISAADLAFYYDEMVRSHLQELEIQTPGGKIVLKRLTHESRGHPLRRRSDVSSEFFHEPVAAPAPRAAAVEANEIPSNWKTISSPIIGVLYRASTPQSAPFVKDGDVVEAGATVCIVEAMKVMNEIKADCRARIVKILVENAKPVTKGQALFHIEPA